MRYAIVYFSSMTALFVAALVAAGCQGVAIQTPSSEPAVSVPVGRVALSWENTTEAHPERAPWSDYRNELTLKDLAVYEKAKDITLFCPKFAKLDQAGKVKAIGELWVATAYYESSYNPKSASVDVGMAGKRDTYSVGLFQVSVVDQEWVTASKKYTYDDLLTALPNIDLAEAIMVRQISRRGLIVVPSSPYWAVLYRGKYDKVDSIIARVKAKAPGCQ